MKLKKFKKNKKVKKMGLGCLISIFLLIGGITLYKTFALYEEKKEFNLLKGKIGEFVENDLELAMTVDGNHTNEVPSKGRYYVDVICDNGAEGRWDYDAWTVVVGNLTKTKVKCMIDFKGPGTLMTTTPNNTNAFWGHKKDITRIVFENRIKPYTNALYTYDVSATQDGSVMSYLVANENDTSTFTLYIQGNGGVMANVNSHALFNGFVNTTSIENLEYLDTSNVKDMSFMFRQLENITSIDVSSLNVSKVTNMMDLFGYDYKLQTIIGLENWDTSNVSVMRGVFYRNKSLESVNLSNFKTNNAISMAVMFYECFQLSTIDLSNFSIDKVDDTENMFLGMPNTIKIKANENIKQWILTLSVADRPSAWSENNFS